MEIQLKFGNLKGLYVIAYLLLLGGIIVFLSSIYDLLKNVYEIGQQDKIVYFIQDAFLIGLNGFLLFIVLLWVAKKLKEKQLCISLK